MICKASVIGNRYKILCSSKAELSLTERTRGSSPLEIYVHLSHKNIQLIYFILLGVKQVKKKKNPLLLMYVFNLIWDPRETFYLIPYFSSSYSISLMILLQKSGNI